MKLRIRLVNLVVIDNCMIMKYIESGEVKNYGYYFIFDDLVKIFLIISRENIKGYFI